MSLGAANPAGYLSIRHEQVLFRHLFMNVCVPSALIRGFNVIVTTVSECRLPDSFDMRYYKSRPQVVT